MPTAPGMLGRSRFSRLRQEQLRRWHELGVRGNPFGSLPEEDEPEVLEHLEPFAALVAPLAAAAEFSAVVMQAPRGWGKSTLLQVWARELRQRGESFQRHVLRPGDRLPRPLRAPWLLLDEAQRLVPSDRRRLRRWLRQRGHRLVATTHEELRPWLPGKVVCWSLPGPGPRELQRWFAQRVARFGGDPARVFLTPAAACWLVRRWAGNIHEIQNRLYHLFETATAEELMPLDALLWQGAAAGEQPGCFVSSGGESTME